MDETMQTASKTYTVKWRVRDRVNKGGYCHEATFQNADYRVRDLDAETVLDGWYAANCDVDDDSTFLDYLIFDGNDIIGDGQFNYFANHEDDESEN